MTILILHGIGGYAGIHWQRWLNDELTKLGNVVLMPTLPNADHPDREVWLKTVIKELEHVDEQLIIVGHSLGVTTALDYIEQSQIPLKGLICVSGFASNYGAELNSYFLRIKNINFNMVRNNLSFSYVIYGDNDPYVTQAALKEVAIKLAVDPLVIHNGGHLNTDTGYTKFPKVLELIQQLQ